GSIRIFRTGKTPACGRCWSCSAKAPCGIRQQVVVGCVGSATPVLGRTSALWGAASPTQRTLPLPLPLLAKAPCGIRQQVVVVVGCVGSATPRPTGPKPSPPEASPTQRTLPLHIPAS